MVNEGGSRSSKSHSIGQLFVERLLTQHNKKILVSRKTGPSLRGTAMAQVINLLKESGAYSARQHNKTDREYRHGSNLMSFISIDDPEKIKSRDWNYVWFEEANEFTKEDFMAVYLRMSAPTIPGEPNQIFISYNPNDESNWIYDLIDRDDVTHIHSTYLDNPFLSTEYVKALRRLQAEDPEYWEIYGLGLRRKPTDLIYTNWNLIPSMPDLPDESFWGLDFGFNSQTALCRVVLLDGEVYVDENLYKTGMTNKRLIQHLEKEVPKRDSIYADTEKNRIAEIDEAGFDIYPADKAVLDGIDFLQRFNINISEDSVNLIKEIKKYKWRKDSRGNKLDAPVKWEDHLMDAMRYGIYTHGKKYGIKPPTFREHDLAKDMEKKRKRRTRTDFSGYN